MFVLAKDDDGHNYVVPAERSAEFSDIIEAIDHYWSGDVDDDGSNAPQIPTWAIEVGGALSLVQFPSFTLGGKEYSAAEYRG